MSTHDEKDVRTVSEKLRLQEDDVPHFVGSREFAWGEAWAFVKAEGQKRKVRVNGRRWILFPSGQKALVTSPPGSTEGRKDWRELEKVRKLGIDIDEDLQEEGIPCDSCWARALFGQRAFHEECGR